eukprot:530510-Rhodomonas_salina.6
MPSLLRALVRILRYICSTAHDSDNATGTRYKDHCKGHLPRTNVVPEPTEGQYSLEFAVQASLCVPRLVLRRSSAVF